MLHAIQYFPTAKACRMGHPAVGSVEKVIAGSPKGGAAICNLMYIKIYGLLRSARNDWNGSFSTLPVAWLDFPNHK